MPAVFITRRPIAIAAIAVVAAAGFTACGSDEASAPDPAADREVIDDATITLDDLPEGYEEGDDADDDEDGDESDECFEDIGADPDALDEAKVTEGDEANFQFATDEVLIGVTAEITSFDDTDAPKENIEAVGNADFLDCAVASIEESSAEDGQDVGEVNAEAIDAPVDGDAVEAAGAVHIEFETQGFPTVVEQHLVLVGRFGIALQVLTVNQEVDEDLVADLLETMIERIEDATG